MLALMCAPTYFEELLGVYIHVHVDDITIYTEVQCTCKSSSIILSPYFEGYVGPGMLSVAVAGAVFASPPPGSILTALRHVTKPDSGKLGSEGGKFTPTPQRKH